MLLVVLVIVLVCCIVSRILYVLFSRKVPKKIQTVSIQNPARTHAFYRMHSTDYRPQCTRNLERHLNQLISTRDLSELVRIGTIYRTGSYPDFRADPFTAMQCFRIAASAPDPSIATDAQIRYIETYADPISAVDNSGKNLDTRYANFACNVAREIIQTLPPGLRPRVTQTQPPRHQAQQTVNENPQNVIRTARVQSPPDSQNVHDHAVVNSVSRNIKKLLRDYQDTVHNSSNFEKEITDAIGKSTDPSIKTNAMKVFTALNSTNQHSKYSATEREILHAAYSKISDIRRHDPELADGLTETLVKQLASGVERGAVVCSTGKIARIAGTFDGSGILGESIVDLPTLKREIIESAGVYANLADGSQRFETDTLLEYVGTRKLNKDIVNKIIAEAKLGFS